MQLPRTPGERSLGTRDLGQTTGRTGARARGADGRAALRPRQHALWAPRREAPGAPNSWMRRAQKDVYTELSFRDVFRWRSRAIMMSIHRARIPELRESASSKFRSTRGAPKSRMRHAADRRRPRGRSQRGTRSLGSVLLGVSLNGGFPEWALFEELRGRAVRIAWQHQTRPI